MCEFPRFYTLHFLTSGEQKRKKKVGHLKYLQFPRDGTKTRQSKEAPHSVHSCEQSPQAGGGDRVGSVGGQGPTVVLQDHIDGVLHRSLHRN